MIVAIRTMGKKQLGQFQPYELAMALLIADILATPMSNVSTPLLHGVLPICAMIGVHALITIICLKSDKARALISGKPSLIISGGVIDIKELNRLSLSLSDLLEGLREFGIINIWDVECAVMEANGTITAFPKSNKRPPNSEDLKLKVKTESLPLALIMDGKIQIHNLNSAGINQMDLIDYLLSRKINPENIYLATIDNEKKLIIEDMNSGIHEFSYEGKSA